MFKKCFLLQDTQPSEAEPFTDQISQIRKTPLFRFCGPILDIFGLTLLKYCNTLWNFISFISIQNESGDTPFFAPFFWFKMEII